MSAAGVAFCSGGARTGSGGGAVARLSDAGRTASTSVPTSTVFVRGPETIGTCVGVSPRVSRTLALATSPRWISSEAAIAGQIRAFCCEARLGVRATQTSVSCGGLCGEEGVSCFKFPLAIDNAGGHSFLGIELLPSRDWPRCGGVSFGMSLETLTRAACSSFPVSKAPDHSRSSTGVGSLERLGLSLPS